RASEKVRYVENSLLLKRQPLDGLYSNLSSYCTHCFLFCHRSASNKYERSVATTFHILPVLRCRSGCWSMSYPIIDVISRADAARSGGAIKAHISAKTEISWCVSALRRCHYLPALTSTGTFALRFCSRSLPRQEVPQMSKMSI